MFNVRGLGLLAWGYLRFEFLILKPTALHFCVRFTRFPVLHGRLNPKSLNPSSGSFDGRYCLLTLASGFDSGALLNPTGA